MILRRSKSKVVTRYVTKPIGPSGPKQLGYGPNVPRNLPPGINNPQRPMNGPVGGQQRPIGPNGPTNGTNNMNQPRTTVPGQVPRPPIPGARVGGVAQKPGMQTPPPPPPKIEINAPPKSLAPKRK